MRAAVNDFRSFLRYLPVIAGFFLLYACDQMGDDVAPRNPQVKIERTEVFALSKTNAYIDLHSMIKASGEVTLSIDAQPTKGTLKELSLGFLAYKPNKNLVKGNDEFVVSVFNKRNELVDTDTIHIIIEDDTTQLPCGIYPQDDSVYHTTGIETVDVLANDVWCGDSTNLGIEIYRPDTSFPPFDGTAVVQNNRIVYTPGSSFTGFDQMIYKVYSKTDPSKFGFAQLRILPVPVCLLSANQDTFSFLADTVGHGDSLRLPVLYNDSLCSGQSYTKSIVKFPTRGLAAWNNNHIQYVVNTFLDSGFAFTDTLRYKLCNGGECQSADVYIKVTK
jgi:hypothetical protein